MKKMDSDLLGEFIEEHCDPISTVSEELRICCPFCGESSYKMYFNQNNGKYFCFKCQARSGKRGGYPLVAATLGIPLHSAEEWVMQNMHHCSYSWEEVADKTSLEENDRDVPVVYFPEIKWPDGIVLAVENEEALSYCRARGLSKKDVEILKIRFSPDSSTKLLDNHGEVIADLGKRIIFPIYHEGKLVSWLARDVTNKSFLKYLNAPGTLLKNLVWPMLESESTVLVEGLIDSYALRKININSHATFGKSLTNNQITILKSLGIKKICMFWDAKDAKKEMIKIAESLSDYFEVYVPNLSKWPSEKDSGDSLTEIDLQALLSDMLKEENWIDFNSMDAIMWRMKLK